MKIVSLISGGGTTNRRVLEEQQTGGRLHGLVETVAIVSSDFQASGIQKALEVGFPKEHIHVVNPAIKKIKQQLLAILDFYRPDYFHQMGWYPYTPEMVGYKGLNQHLGPGGKYMYYGRRIYAYMRFCEKIGELRPLPIFCQFVALKLDDGDVVYVSFEDVHKGESVGKVAQRVLPIEHEVQIHGLWLLATNQENPSPVPRIYKNSEEEKVMDSVRYEAGTLFAENEEAALSHRFFK